MQGTRGGYIYKTLEQVQAEKALEAAKRIPVNPIHVGRRYADEHLDGHGMTYGGIGRKYGVSRAEVCYHVALVKRLPEEFVSWLGQCNDPDVLRVLTERRLRPITKLQGHMDQYRAMKSLPLDIPVLSRS